jgi:hypothetical protein
MSREGRRQEPLDFPHPASHCVPLILKLGISGLHETLAENLRQWVIAYGSQRIMKTIFSRKNAPTLAANEAGVPYVRERFNG